MEKYGTICPNCKDYIFRSSDKKLIKIITKGIVSLGYDYNEDICPNCNSGQTVKAMINENKTITHDVLKKLTKHIYFDDADKLYADTLDKTINNIRRKVADI